MVKFAVDARFDIVLFMVDDLRFGGPRFTFEDAIDGDDVARGA